MPDKVSELFAAPRGKLILAGKYSGKEFYTSAELKESYLIAIQKSSKASSVYRSIFDLVRRGVIIPVYKQKGFLRGLLKQNPIEFEGMAGLALPQFNLIYIFVETQANLFSFVPNNALATVTLHELMHLFSHRKPKEFLELFESELNQFYKTYFCKILSCNPSKVPDKEVSDLTKFIYSTFEIGNFYSADVQKFVSYYNKLNEIFKDKSTLSAEVFEKNIRDFVVMLKIIQKFEVYGKGHEIIKVAMAYKNLISPLYITYKEIFKVNALKENQFTYQELFYPSEIISLLTLGSPPSKIYQAVNKL
jgi:hypothetical protein